MEHMEHIERKAQKSNATLAICITALFMALNIMMSSFGLPVPGGHLYLNDVIICTAAILLDDPKAAFIVGGVIAVYVLILILATVFSFSPDQSGTTAGSSQSVETIVEKG